MEKHICQINLEARWFRQGHASGVIWLTGLSGAGKSALAVGLERVLFDQGTNCETMVPCLNSAHPCTSPDFMFKQGTL